MIASKLASYLSIFLVFLLTGCATIPGDPAKMTAEQIREAVKDKTIAVGCGTTETPYKINMVFVAVDRLVLRNGKMTIGRDCSITYENMDKPGTGLGGTGLGEAPVGR